MYCLLTYIINSWVSKAAVHLDVSVTFFFVSLDVKILKEFTKHAKDWFQHITLDWRRLFHTRHQDLYISIRVWVTNCPKGKIKKRKWFHLLGCVCVYTGVLMFLKCVWNFSWVPNQFICCARLSECVCVCGCTWEAKDPNFRPVAEVAEVTSASSHKPLQRFYQQTLRVSSSDPAADSTVYSTSWAGAPWPWSACCGPNTASSSRACYLAAVEPQQIRHDPVNGTTGRKHYKHNNRAK